MTDDFTKQLQENTVDKGAYYSQQEEQKEEYERAKEKRRIELYKEIIEKTKVACLEAVKQGNYEIDNNSKKIVGTLAFYYQWYDDTDDTFGVNCLINGKLYFNIYKYGPIGSNNYNGTIRGLSEDDILFLVSRTTDVDISNIFDKLRNKKKSAHYLEYITDSKSLQLFTDLFQTSINNSKIIDISEIPNCRRFPKSDARKLDFEIVF